MRVTYIKYVLLLSVALIIEKVCSNVDLEFEIVSFSNPNSKLKSGKCCFGNEGSRGRCPLTCRTFFTACAYGGATGGTCQTKHYTHLQSGIMGNSTFGSNGAHLDQSDHVNKFVIRGKTRKSLQNGLMLDIEANNKNSFATSNSSLIAEFRVNFGQIMTKLNRWTKSEIVAATYAGGTVALEIRARASCSTNFYGDDCLSECLDEPEFNQMCDENGNKVCISGYAGDYCDQPVCEDGCENGFCQGPNQCMCHPGFTGPTCSDCVTSPGCKNGFCVDNRRPFTCSCEVGWGGPNCDVDLEYCTRMSPCKNGGKCLSSRDPSSGNLYKCQCPVGFSGYNCEHVSGCSKPGYCQNGGKCTSEDSDVCQCPKDWTGPRCDMRATCDVVGCQNGATCERSITTNKPYCACTAGFIGSFCEIEDPCLSGNGQEDVCKNGGICESEQDGSFQCHCARGFTGKRCETTAAAKMSCDVNPCQNGGICVKFSETSRCNCVNGYTGSFCTIKKRPCQENPCENGGQCIVFDVARDLISCDCPVIYYGKYCQYLDVLALSDTTVVAAQTNSQPPESSHKSPAENSMLKPNRDKSDSDNLDQNSVPQLNRGKSDSGNFDQNGSEERRSENKGNSLDLKLEVNVEDNSPVIGSMEVLIAALFAVLFTCVVIVSLYVILKRVCTRRKRSEQCADDKQWEQLKDMDQMRQQNNNSHLTINVISPGGCTTSKSTPSQQQQPLSIKVNNLERVNQNRDVRNNRNSTVPEKWDKIEPDYSPNISPEWGVNKMTYAMKGSKNSKNSSEQELRMVVHHYNETHSSSAKCSPNNFHSSYKSSNV